MCILQFKVMVRSPNSEHSWRFFSCSFRQHLFSPSHTLKCTLVFFGTQVYSIPFEVFIFIYTGRDKGFFCCSLFSLLVALARLQAMEAGGDHAGAESRQRSFTVTRNERRSLENSTALESLRNVCNCGRDEIKEDIRAWLYMCSVPHAATITGISDPSCRI